MAVTTADGLVSHERTAAYTSTQWGIFVVRLVLGIIFLAHGAQKVLPAGTIPGGHGLAGTVGFMSGMGIPAPLAYLSAFTEFLGGILLIVGALSRVAGIGLFINMVVATLLVHLKNGFFMGNPPGYEFNLALMAMALAVAIAGPGALSLTDIEGKILGLKHRHPVSS